MSNKENIKDKFLSFEPEVDNEIIDKGWEKIKYFVPQKEKKKRGVVFFISGAGVLLLSGIAFVMLYYSPNSARPSYASVNASAKRKPESITDLKANNTKPQKEITKKTNPATEQIGNAEKISMETIVRSNTSKKSSISKTHNNDDVAALTTSNYPVKTQNVLTENNNELNITPDRLAPIPFIFSMNESAVDLFPGFTNDYYFPKPVSPFSIDVFGGAQTSVYNTKRFNAVQKENALNFLGGLAINYHLRNKFSFTGQFMFSKNNLNYSHTVTQNKIVKQVVNISSSPSSLPDTIKYINAYTNYTIRSSQSYHFAVGTGYTLLQKNKFSLGAFILFDMCVTKYNYGYSQEYGKNVLLYTKGNPDPPTANLVSSQFKEGDVFETSEHINAGVMPGIVVGYRINNKISLLFKPAYLTDLTENTLIMNSSAFKLKQNGLLLNAGLRINL